MRPVEEIARDVADLTALECATVCKIPHACCSQEYCNAARRFAMQRGVEYEETGHATLPFMGPDGCVVAPHLRPLCTLHTCEINAFGFKRGDPQWTDRYFDLRDEWNEALFEETKR